jgi:hypothetical protein
MYVKDSGFFSNNKDHPDGVALLSGRMLAELAESSQTQMGVRMLHRPIRTETRYLTFTELETAQNLPGTLKLPS